MAVVQAIEEGESSWDSNFQLLEVLVMGDQCKVGHKSARPLFDSNSDSKSYFVKNTELTIATC